LLFLSGPSPPGRGELRKIKCYEKPGWVNTHTIVKKVIETYQEKYKEGIVQLILNIQQNEFNVPVTINDQPDLLNIKDVYCRKGGNFWVAVENEQVIGTIALIDMSNGQAALRKMFVHAACRGKEKGIGQLLLDILISWCRQKNINEVYLGTVEQLHAAKGFMKEMGL
jgi:GNAT superfamily N-acetyltransferase